MSGYTKQLLDGLAQLIADQGLATYRPDGVYAEGETGITFSVMPDTPDRVLCLTAYPVDDGPLADITTAVQARMRASRDPRDLDDLADDLRDLLHNREHFALGLIHVNAAWRQSQAPMGQDAHGRMELSANYYFRTVRPGPHLYE